MNLIALGLFCLLPLMAWAQAPRDGKRFVNSAGAGERGGFLNVQLPFFLRMIGRSWTSPEGAAPAVIFDPQALQKNPGITWIGHAAFLVRFDGASFLTDPMFSDRASPLSFAGPQRLVAPGVPLDALPGIDFAIISHDHYDHADEDSIRALAQRGVPFVVPLGVGELIRGLGGEAFELDWGQWVDIAGVRVHCVPAQHFSGRSLTDRDQTLWAGFVVQGPTTKFFHAGDTGFFAGFREIGERLGPFDVAALPIGAYAPREMMGHVHMDPIEAVQAALDLGARNVVPMHYGTFVLTDEPLDEPPRLFSEEAARRGFRDEQVWILKVGETRRWGEVEEPAAHGRRPAPN